MESSFLLFRTLYNFFFHFFVAFIGCYGVKELKLSKRDRMIYDLLKYRDLEGETTSKNHVGSSPSLELFADPGAWLDTIYVTFFLTTGQWATSLTWKAVPINKHIFAKLGLYHKVDKETHPLSSFLRIDWSLFVKTWIPLTQGPCAKLGWKWSSGSGEDL